MTSPSLKLGPTCSVSSAARAAGARASAETASMASQLGRQRIIASSPFRAAGGRTPAADSGRSKEAPCYLLQVGKSARKPTAQLAPRQLPLTCSPSLGMDARRGVLDSPVGLDHLGRRLHQLDEHAFA